VGVGLSQLEKQTVGTPTPVKPSESPEFRAQLLESRRTGASAPLIVRREGLPLELEARQQPTDGAWREPQVLGNSLRGPSLLSAGPELGTKRSGGRGGIRGISRKGPTVLGAYRGAAARTRSGRRCPGQTDKHCARFPGTNIMRGNSRPSLRDSHARSTPVRLTPTFPPGTTATATRRVGRASSGPPCPACRSRTSRSA
jgi:hypothetical protein